MWLEEIVRAKQVELARAKRDRPASRLLAELPGPPRPFLTAPLRRTAFIFETKRRSPSAGILQTDYDPVALARSFAPVADAVSVLTDGPYFGGSLTDLRRVRDAVELPVLRKDFILDPYQVVESRWAGADAVLLILSVLDDSAWSECAEAARDLGMAVLTEVHTRAELDRAAALQAPLIGINSRDLKTLEVDPGVVSRLAPAVPEGRIIVAESGIATRADVLALRPFADAFLVGTALMLTADPAAAARRLAYGEVKVCGLTRPEDALSAWEAGATWGGLVFARGSPRRVSVGAARAIRKAAPLRWAGVFVDAAPKRVASIARDLALAAVQLHGEEGREEIEAVRRAVPPECAIWKAVPVGGPVPRIHETGADRVLLDTPDPDRRGGTGRRFDWSLVKGHPDLGHMILAGGIDPSNAAEAEAVGAGILDVGSGVEESPGIKSAVKLAALFAALRGVGRRRMYERLGG